MSVGASFLSKEAGRPRLSERIRLPGAIELEREGSHATQGDRAGQQGRTRILSFDRVMAGRTLRASAAVVAEVNATSFARCPANPSDIWTVVSASANGNDASASGVSDEAIKTEGMREATSDELTP